MVQPAAVQLDWREGYARSGDRTTLERSNADGRFEDVGVARPIASLSDGTGLDRRMLTIDRRRQRVCNGGAKNCRLSLNNNGMDASTEIRFGTAISPLSVSATSHTRCRDPTAPR